MHHSISKTRTIGDILICVGILQNNLHELRLVRVAHHRTEDVFKVCVAGGAAANHAFC